MISRKIGPYTGAHSPNKRRSAKQHWAKVSRANSYLELQDEPQDHEDDPYWRKRAACQCEECLRKVRLP